MVGCQKMVQPAFAASVGVASVDARATGARKCARRRTMVCQSSASSSASGAVTRRGALLTLASLAGACTLPSPATAGDLSGLVTPYKDLPKGWTILRPSGWNEFEGSPGEYDIKWADIIQPLEFVTVSTSPIASSKSLSSIGTASAVGEKIAKSRGGELVEVGEKDIEGVPAYVVEIRKGEVHQITLLAVNKAKLYSVSVSSGEKRWKKRERLLRGVVDSFRPKL